MTTIPFSLQPSALSLRGRRLRRGFSFTEVLFAVMILGIGFILIAGIFPVAISQTALSQDDTIGASTARGAVAAYSSLPYLSSLIPNDGLVTRFTDDAVNVPVGATTVSVKPWSLVKGNQVLAEDQRYGWIAMVRREAADMRGQPPNTALLIVVPVQLRGESAFTVVDSTQNATGPSSHATLMPVPVQVTMTDGGNNPDQCVVSGAYAGAAAPGAVVVLRSGRIYRLGNLVEGSMTTYTMLPGNDLASSAEAVTSADAYIVGRRCVHDPANPNDTPTFEGTSIAIGTYVTYIQLR